MLEIENTKYEAFSEVVQKYCTTSVDKSALLQNPESFSSKYHQILSEMNSVQENCVDTKAMMAELKIKAEALSLIERKFKQGIHDIMKTLQEVITKKTIDYKSDRSDVYAFLQFRCLGI